MKLLSILLMVGGLAALAVGQTGHTFPSDGTGTTQVDPSTATAPAVEPGSNQTVPPQTADNTVTSAPSQEVQEVTVTIDDYKAMVGYAARRQRAGASASELRQLSSALSRIRHQLSSMHYNIEHEMGKTWGIASEGYVKTHAKLTLKESENYTDTKINSLLNRLGLTNSPSGNAAGNDGAQPAQGDTRMDTAAFFNSPMGGFLILGVATAVIWGIWAVAGKVNHMAGGQGQGQQPAAQGNPITQPVDLANLRGKLYAGRDGTVIYTPVEVLTGANLASAAEKAAGLSRPGNATINPNGGINLTVS